MGMEKEKNGESKEKSSSYYYSDKIFVTIKMLKIMKNILLYSSWLNSLNSAANGLIC
jgi:hypothetical protein